MSPGTELARDFCAGIGPLQLGVVLVFFFNFDHIRGGEEGDFCAWSGPPQLAVVLVIQNVQKCLKYFQGKGSFTNYISDGCQKLTQVDKEGRFCQMLMSANHQICSQCKWLKRQRPHK